MLTVISHCQLQFHMPTARAWIACVALAVVPTEAVAQQGSRVWPSLDSSKLPTVYVRDASGTETAGRLLSIDAGSLVILADGAERRFDVEEVSRFERRGDSLRNGAIAGAVVGMVLGVLGAAVSDCPDPGAGAGCPGARVAMFLGSTAIWTSVGTAIDAAIPGRTTLYVASPTAAARSLGSPTAAISASGGLRPPASVLRPALRLTVRW